MRITFVILSDGLSGGTRVASIYADKLRRRGHDLTVVSTPGRPRSWRARLRGLLREARLRGRAAKTVGHMQRAGLTPHVIDRYRPITDADVPDADVVVAFWWETAEWVAGLSPRKGAKAYFCQHYEMHAWLPLERVRATYESPLMQICVSQWVRERIREEHGRDDGVVVPNAVDLDLFHAPPRERNRPLRIGFMYSTSPFKACEVAIEAVRMARERMPDLQVWAFGAHPPAPELALPEGTEFTLRPAQEKLREIYGGCDAWLFSSRAEGFGLPILESMACRTPVIGTPTGAGPELIEQGGGVLVPLEDSAAMARAIEQVASMSDAEWRAMSDAAFETATRYSWEDATDRFEEALEQAQRFETPERRACRSAGVAEEA